MGIIQALIQTLTFPQLLTLFIVFLGACGVSVTSLVRFLHNKNYTMTMDNTGKKIKLHKKDSLNTMLLFEALKIKDDIHRVEELSFKAKKKKAKELLPKAQNIHLSMFKDLVCSRCSIDENDKELLENHDFLYYSLLLEKAYTSVFSSICDAFDENGLASKEYIFGYTTEKAETLFSYSVTIIDSLYMGVLDVNKKVHDVSLAGVKPLILNVYSEIFQNAITLSKKEHKKKEELKSLLYEKIHNIDGMSHYQIENLFSTIDPSEFLGVD